MQNAWSSDILYMTEEDGGTSGTAKMSAAGKILELDRKRKVVCSNLWNRFGGS